MNREDIIRMAREAGFADGIAEFIGLSAFDRFAALVAKHTLLNLDPSSFMSWQEGYEAGKQTEREACAELCKELAPSNKTMTAYKVLHEASKAIQSRGRE